MPDYIIDLTPLEALADDLERQFFGVDGTSTTITFFEIDDAGKYAPVLTLTENFTSETMGRPGAQFKRIEVPDLPPVTDAIMNKVSAIQIGRVVYKDVGRQAPDENPRVWVFTGQLTGETEADLIE
jgi:hypothetical protein